jgi:drug/metabolite transporter (DMT)-like permease
MDTRMTPSSPSRPASKTAIWAAMLSIYIVWGSTYLAMRIGVQTIPPFVMAGVRFILAGGILLISQWLRGERMPPLRQWRSAVIVGLFLLLGGNGLVVWAEQTVPSGIAALLVGMTPLWIVLLEMIFFRRRPSWLVLGGVLIGLVGMIVLIGPSELTGLHGDINLLGGVAVVIGALSWAGGSLYSRNADLPASAFLFNGMEMLSGGVALLLLATVTGEWSRLNVAAISLNSWLGFLYLVFIGSLVGFSSYTWLLRSGAPTMLVSTYAYINPVVAVVIGNLLVQEPLTPRVVLAALIIVSGVVLITFTGKKKEPASQD